MKHSSTVTLLAAMALVAGLSFLATEYRSTDGLTAELQPASFIIRGESLETVRAAVLGSGGEITHELGVISGVAATLTAGQLADLRESGLALRFYENGTVETAAKGGGGKGGGSTNGGGNYTAINTHYAQLVNADDLHSMGITGAGIGIAVLDTGLWKHDGIRYDTAGNTRLKALYNAITDSESSSPLSGDDPAGHGSHVASISVSSLMTADGLYNGIAPGAHLISVQAFDENGRGTYADVIRAIDWVVANRKKHKVRVMNLSFSAEPRSWYWDDPINQAVMVAWQKEIFVVASAGNRGPYAMTIGVPGNLPYIMTVGAMTDNYTPEDPTDDTLATFSSAGPTFEGFVKPEVVAPGGHVLGLVQGGSTLAETFPDYYVHDMYFEMSGTSQATAVVSGIAALALQAEAWHGVDALKCKIMSAARPAVTGNGGNQTLTYSVFQQGAGLVDAHAAVFNQTVDCANRGLHIDNDIDGYQHFGGRANRDADGSYYLRGDDLDSKESGYTWTDGNLWADGNIWSDSYLWSDGYAWNEPYLWTDGLGVDGNLWTDGNLWADGNIWSDGYTWTDGNLWADGNVWSDSLSEMASMSTWVDPE